MTRAMPTLVDWPSDEATTPNEFRYGPWIVRRNWTKNKYPDTWEFEHTEYDGPGDGSPEEYDPRYGYGRTLAEVREAIYDLEEAHRG